MNLTATRSTIAVLYSGGLDSAILLAHLLESGQRVQPLFVDSQLVWQQEELRHARRFADALACEQLEELVVLQMPLADLYHDHWSITGRDVPSSADPDESVYLPGRNPLLLVKARVWCGLNGVGQLALGALHTNPFADATDTFFLQFEGAMDQALGGHVKIVRPLAHLNKRQVMYLGRHAPLELTLSCLAPSGGRHCGRCNKCAERRVAFELAGLADPTSYAPPARSLTH